MLERDVDQCEIVDYRASGEAVFFNIEPSIVENGKNALINGLAHNIIRF